MQETLKEKVIDEVCLEMKKIILIQAGRKKNSPENERIYSVKYEINGILNKNA